MKKCPNCGTLYSDSESFCATCGVGLEKQKSTVKPILIGCSMICLIIIGVTTGVLLHNTRQQQNPTGSVAETPSVTIEPETTPVAASKSEEQNEKNVTDTTPTPSVQAKDTPIPGSAEEPVQEAAISNNDTTDSSTATTYQTYYVVNCKESISLRESPSTRANTNCQIPLGDAVQVIEGAENGFYKVSYNGQTGYALASYLSLDATDSPTTQTIMYVVNCKQSITLRKTPSTSGDEFCQIPLGASVTYLSTAENGFYMISYNGYTGYALASYLSR